ncbi:hypothetical protein BS78_02G028900 [Paspalum vaginatum]|nr:hypothetical protein BS78_02G028900 [Paspalum vaginatum]
MALARVVVTLAYQAHPLQVLRPHGFLPRHPLLDDGDLAPDGEAVVLEEPGTLEGLPADESPEAPRGLSFAKAGGGLHAVRPVAGAVAVVHQSELEFGVDDAPGGDAVSAVEEQGHEAGVLRDVPVEIATEPPGLILTCLLEVAAVLAVRVLQPRVALDLEQVVPGAHPPWRRRWTQRPPPETTTTT